MQVDKNILILTLMKKKTKIFFLILHFHLTFTTGTCYGIIEVYVELMKKFEFPPSF